MAEDVALFLNPAVQLGVVGVMGRGGLGVGVTMGVGNPLQCIRKNIAAPSTLVLTFGVQKEAVHFFFKTGEKCHDPNVKILHLTRR